MNGNLQSSHVKNETTYNIPLLINENVISSGISLISLWHTYADKHYRVIWPRDKKKPLIANSWVAVYTVQGCGKVLLKDGEQITLNGNCIIFLKPTDIQSYHCEGLVWEQYWMEFTPTSVMDIPIRQQSVIYNGENYNQELMEVSQLITVAEPVKNNLAVAFLTKIIYQWICLICANGKADPQRVQIEKLLAALHASLQRRWSVAEMAAALPCSEAWLRRLFLRYTGKTPKEYVMDARLELALSLLKQEGNTVSQVADTLNFFDSFHFSKAFKHKFGYAPSAVLKHAK
ncbi:AraC family transcriptional regulator [Salmonella enterica subsp. salamae]|uniref:AraC family transcriptional regulator n=1 Tax=Salmonella enterica subsp. salamae TaxID=59202 RepID=A0A5Y3UUL7_SALER|nr:AraC family transcriptional regulator [Salmonella enterica subsp. salamae]EDH0693046.1 AraC family transcriptional regulator [Salmonella enterica]EHM1752651.1 AraC family transcriptional regulator [Salmonella enterica subsp. salamae serovar 40:c:e,n,x,z15]HCM1915105.1 AraC family transcriptional regulator [Salmonella enterica subsp. salamae serovar 28:r:e,n,z15]HCM2000762.1 AraC family transcriptional regulator [Salmonella enterica subsp. salamae serovar [1],40:z35:e,n,x,z15]